MKQQTGRWGEGGMTEATLFIIIIIIIILAVCRILVPQPGIEPGPSAVKARTNHWTTREFPEATLSRVVREDFCQEVASELRKPGEWMS